MTTDELREVKKQIGIIDVSFPEVKNPKFEDFSDFPQSYWTLTPKEKLILMFAENFRQQHNEKHIDRMPLVLAPKNECGIQKFVSTTIRPTSLHYPDLIGSWEKISSFVADHIEYEPLTNPTTIPERLISPDTLLRRRQGNSFEMATLLCSLLLGSGFGSFVVSGYASREVTTNDQTRVSCPCAIPDDNPDCSANNTDPKKKYSLRPPVDLRSQFLVHMDEMEANRKRSEEEKRREEERRRVAELEQLPEDEFAGRRVHAWVAIRERDSGQMFFVEPSTGIQVTEVVASYFGIESVWNQHNYYVNRQRREAIADETMRWDLVDRNDWEHFLMDGHDEDHLRAAGGSGGGIVMAERNLDMPISWVNQLKIELGAFERRFPAAEKSIKYKRVIYERFSPYRQESGLVKRLTTYETLEYEHEKEQWQWFSNRKDFLEMIKILRGDNSSKEYFIRGRPDYLKFIAKPLDEKSTQRIYEFYHAFRMDSLSRLEMDSTHIREYYTDRDDFLQFREFTVAPNCNFKQIEASQIKSIEERFRRNDKKAALDDVATRKFLISENRITLRFHYEKNSITASTREFLKPVKPNYQEEVTFDVNSTKGYQSNITSPAPTAVELYLMLLEQLEAEEGAIKSFLSRCGELRTLEELRRREMLKPSLKISIFDPLRNDEARRLRIERVSCIMCQKSQFFLSLMVKIDFCSHGPNSRHATQYEMMRRREEMAQKDCPDFLAPYLVGIQSTEANAEPPSYDTSLSAFNSCLSDKRQHFEELLQELQRQYQELDNETKSLRSFVLRFQDRFDDSDFENIVKEGESIKRHRNVIQNRMTCLRQESQEKYQKVKNALLRDKRLKMLA
ncbi:coiled-coil domain-containing protein lobo [Phlebotomus argentipes]|uniref:coiled-coil domain-containing protein lobo n=1 Tax=Phlebotomus argentipes TaxID=94469 RepID=UPI002892CFBD|nr:coiled-coil domain-containing protein lobo [Phlebotomus argentipes]